MDSVLIPALRELREDIQATNKSVKELREEFEAIATETKQTRDHVDSVQAAAHEVLKGAQQAYPVKCAQNNVTLLFFPDFSPATAIRRKAFGPVLKKMTALGLQPFLIYPAVIKLRHKGEQRSFDSLQKAEDFVSSLSQRRTYAAARREGLDGRDGHGPSCPGGDDGRMNMDAC